jgi:hypothetical protein
MFDLDPTSTIRLYALLWLTLLLFVIWRGPQSLHGSVGLPLTFVASYTAAHFGALVHLVDRYKHYHYPFPAGLIYTKRTVAVIESALPRFGVQILGLQAVISSLRNLALVGAGSLLLHSYVSSGVKRSLLLAIALAAIIPALFLVTVAVLAESVSLAIGILAFFVLLKTDRSDLSADEAWRIYALLRRAEDAFRDMKTPRAERPIFH